MKVLHPNPRPTAPRAGALPPRHLLAAVLALAPLLLASCTDDVAANCPRSRTPRCSPSRPPPVARVRRGGGVGHPAARPGAQDVPAIPAAGEGDHCDPMNDQACNDRIAATLEHGTYAPQASGNPRFTLRYNDTQSGCHGGDWPFRVVVGGGTFSYAGIITAFPSRARLPPTPDRDTRRQVR